jgi:hypothetical protein
MMDAWSSKRPSSVGAMIAPAPGLVLAHRSGGRSAEGGVAVRHLMRYRVFYYVATVTLLVVALQIVERLW